MSELTILHAETTDIDLLHGDNSHAICVVGSVFVRKMVVMFGQFVKKSYLCKVLRGIGGKV